MDRNVQRCTGARRAERVVAILKNEKAPTTREIEEAISSRSSRAGDLKGYAVGSSDAGAEPPTVTPFGSTVGGARVVHAVDLCRP